MAGTHCRCKWSPYDCRVDDYTTTDPVQLNQSKCTFCKLVPCQQYIHAPPNGDRVPGPAVLFACSKSQFAATVIVNTDDPHYGHVACVDCMRLLMDEENDDRNEMAPKTPWRGWTSTNGVLDNYNAVCLPLTQQISDARVQGLAANNLGDPVTDDLNVAADDDQVIDGPPSDNVPTSAEVDLTMDDMSNEVADEKQNSENTTPMGDGSNHNTSTNNANNNVNNNVNTTTDNNSSSDNMTGNSATNNTTTNNATNKHSQPRSERDQALDLLTVPEGLPTISYAMRITAIMDQFALNIDAKNVKDAVERCVHLVKTAMVEDSGGALKYHHINLKSMHTATYIAYKAYMEDLYQCISTKRQRRKEREIYDKFKRKPQQQQQRQQQLQQQRQATTTNVERPKPPIPSTIGKKRPIAAIGGLNVSQPQNKRRRKSQIESHPLYQQRGQLPTSVQNGGPSVKFCDFG